jgi:hypothetical protein
MTIFHPWKTAAGGIAVACAVLGATPRAGAAWWDQIFEHDVDVITVTDVTEAGHAFAPATPAKPVYYMIIDLGLQNFGRAWAGERIPNHRTARQWLMDAMAVQGFKLADQQHRPTQLFVFAWGLCSGGPGALKFLGGDKVDLMWEYEQNGGMIDPRVLLRGIKRMGVTGKIWDFSQDDLFIGIVRSYTMDSLHGPNTTLLWETRFGCPALGLWLADTLPLMIKTAAPNFGRETPLPVNVNASERFRTEVGIGELKVMGTEPAGGDGSKPDRKPPGPDPR